MSGTNEIKSYAVPKKIEYIYYTYPEVNSNYEFSVTSTPFVNNGNNSGSFKGEFMKIIICFLCSWLWLWFLFKLFK